MRFSQALVVSLVAFAGSTFALVAEQPGKEAPKVAAPVAAPALDMKAPLPWDPNIVRGTLDNGLSYLVVKHANPPGRATIWMHVYSGSLNENDDTRGIAHYTEHMAFNGSKNFPPGSVVDFFQSLGMQFGRDQNAFTNFEQTTYQLSLPDAKPETIDRGLLFFGDVGGRLSLIPKEIDDERQIILEERRRGLGAQQRMQDRALPLLAPESTIGKRLTIGLEETIKGVNKANFDDYYTRFYTASNETVMVVADADPQMVIERIKKAFGDLPTKPRPAPIPTGTQATKGVRAIISTDPDLKKTGSMSVVRVEPPKPPSTTVGQERSDLIDTLGNFAFNRRISALQAKGAVTFSSGSASAQNLANAARLISVEAGGNADDWRKDFTEMARELQRARLHGFSERELADVRTQLISSAEESVQREGTIQTAALMNRMNRDVTNHEPMMSPQQRLDLLKALLPTITTSEVSERFATTFTFDNAVFEAQLPGDVAGGLPTEADVIKAGKEALSVKPDAMKEDARATALMTDLPSGGKVVKTETDPATKVTTAVLSNGIIVHHRFMDINKNEATVSIVMAGGTINETAANRGIAEAARVAGATSTLSSTQIRDLMVGKKVRFGGGGGGGGGGRRGGGGGGGGGLDAVTYSISGNPEDFEAGFQLAYLMLTDPVIEPAEFARWQERQEQFLAMRNTNAGMVLVEALTDALYPAGEVRTRALTLDQLHALTIPAVQKWMKEFNATAPIEVTVIGDIKAEQVMPLIARYLGSLPERKPIDNTLYADLRKIKRPTGPINITKTADTKTDQAVVVDGFFGPDASNIRETRLMQIAARILSTRMIKAIREEQQLVYSINASFTPGKEFPGYGRFAAQAPTDPLKADKLGPALDELYVEFAKTGPTEEEMTTARKQFAVLFDEQYKDTSFWQTRLSDLAYRGNKLEDIVNAPEFYQTAKAEDIRATFAKYYKPEGRFSGIVKPEAGAKPAEMPVGGSK